MSPVPPRLALLSLLAVAASAAEPKELLQAATDAARKLVAVQYDAELTVSGPLADRLPSVTGRVTANISAADQPPRFRIHASLTMPGARQPREFDAAVDGATARTADHTARVFRELEWPRGAALVDAPALLLIPDLTGGQDWLKTAGEARLSSAGVQTVGAEACDVVRAVRPQREERWYFAQSDHLPRRIERTYPSSAGRSTVTLTLTQLTTPGALADSAFGLDRPADYTDPTERTKPEAPTAAGEERSQLLAIGSVAPDWTLKTPDGREISLANLRGKVVVLDFWATWCGPCKLAMPGMQRLHEHFHDKPVAVFGVNCWESPEADPAAFMKKNKFTYPLLLGGDEVASAYKVSGIPAFYVIGPDGKVLLARVGFSEAAEERLKTAIEGALRRLDEESGVQPG